MLKIKKKNVIAASVVSLILLFLSSSVPVLRTPLIDILKFPLSLLSMVKREISGIVFYHRNFMQNEQLKKEISLLKQKLNNMEESNLENTRLKNLISLKEKSPFKVITASVISRGADNWSSLIIIDKGANDGIKKGMVVLSFLGLVGRVVETADNTSKIMLLNDPNFSVSALVQRSRQEGLVSGTLGNYLIMKYLPKDADINVSDKIISSGLTHLYPKGLIIGTVVDIGEEFSGLSRYAVIRPAVDVSNIEEVLIIVQ